MKNTERTASTRPANRRNQPRTVSTGHPNAAATRRCHRPPWRPTPPRSPPPRPPAAATPPPAAAHASPHNRCTATAADAPTAHPPAHGPSAAWPTPTRPAPPNTLGTPASRPPAAARHRQRRSLPSPPRLRARPTALPPDSGKTSGRAVTIYDLVTVAAPANRRHHQQDPQDPAAAAVSHRHHRQPAGHRPTPNPARRPGTAQRPRLEW
jgi:hypothetical protein